MKRWNCSSRGPLSEQHKVVASQGRRSRWQTRGDPDPRFESVCVDHWRPRPKTGPPAARADYVQGLWQADHPAEVRWEQAIRPRRRAEQEEQMPKDLALCPRARGHGRRGDCAATALTTLNSRTKAHGEGTGRDMQIVEQELAAVERQCAEAMWQLGPKRLRSRWLFRHRFLWASRS